MRTIASTTLLLLWACTCTSQETYTAVLTGSAVTRGGESNSSLASIATAEFTLLLDANTPEFTRLEYSLTAPDFDITGQRTADLLDDVTAVHLHTLTECATATCIAGDTAGTRHVLNIFGTPREDDADLSIDGSASTLRGIWDPSDANNLSPAPTAAPNEFLTELRSEQLFLMLHTREFPGGAIGGIIVPEPTSGSQALLAALTLVPLALGRRSTRPSDDF